MAVVDAVEVLYGYRTLLPVPEVGVVVVYEYVRGPDAPGDRVRLALAAEREDGDMAWIDVADLPQEVIVVVDVDSRDAVCHKEDVQWAVGLRLRVLDERLDCAENACRATVFKAFDE